MKDCNLQIELWEAMKRQEAFVSACWAYKRRERTEEPTAFEFGIPWSLAEVLARQVQKEFEQRVLRKLVAA